MRRRSWCWLLLALSCAACEVDDEHESEDASFPGPDVDAALRDSGFDASHEAGGEAGLIDANLGTDAGGDASSDASSWPPAQPSAYRIGASGGQCLGDCPVYSVELDQTGRVRYFGGLCTVRPGSFTKQVPPADARMLYDALAATQFWRLGDRYATEQDGCPMVWADASTSSGTSTSTVARRCSLIITAAPVYPSSIASKRSSRSRASSAASSRGSQRRHSTAGPATCTRLRWRQSIGSRTGSRRSAC